jgi:hypothetical protein
MFRGGGGFNPASVAITGGTITGITSLSMAGHLIFSPDGTNDIGALGATRPRSIFASNLIQAQATVAARGGTAIPAGGVAAFLVSSTGSFGIFFGSGVPTVSAAQGSLYLRSDGSSTSTRLYVNSSSGSGTTWTSATTAD